MKRYELEEKKYCEFTGKLHIPCPHRETTGVETPVVIKNGHCYRSMECFQFSCKYNSMQNEFSCVLSVIW